MPVHNKPKKNKLSNKSKINGYRNMVYKMLKDKISPVIIKEYAKHKGFTGTDHSLEFFITCISVNNFNKKLNLLTFSKCIEVPGLITIKRNDLLKYITTKNAKINKDKNLEKHFSLIKEKYPIINEIINVYDDFYNIFQDNKESLLDEFIKKYEAKDTINDDTGEIIELDDNIENI